MFRIVSESPILHFSHGNFIKIVNHKATAEKMSILGQSDLYLRVSLNPKNAVQSFQIMPPIGSQNNKDSCLFTFPKLIRFTDVFHSRYLICHRKSIGATNDINDGSVPLIITVQCSK